MSKVWVIMGNDFPDSAFSDEEKAEAYVTAKKAQDRAEHDKDPQRYKYPYSPRIYWRHYEFEVDAKQIRR
jgi:hypothetical protein